MYDIGDVRTPVIIFEIVHDRVLYFHHYHTRDGAEHQ